MVQSALAETVGAYAGDVDEQRFDADFPGGNRAAQTMDREWQSFDRASQSFGGAAQAMDRVAQTFGGAAQVDGRDISSARSAEGSGIEGLIPCYKGKAGYPLLLAPSQLLPIMDYDGQGGMSGVLKELQAAGRVRKVELPDPAICLTCGTAGQYEKLKDYLFSLRTPGLAYCREILAWRNLSQKRLRHMEAVAFYAREMAEEFNSRGRDTYSLLLDENLTTAGGMVHDLGKGYPHHAAAGAATLRSLGLTRVAEIVENHQNLAERYFAGTSPVLIVYLADKMFSGTENVGIEERFARKAKRRQGDTEALEKLEQNKQQALRAQAVYENSILGWPVG